MCSACVCVNVTGGFDPRQGHLLQFQQCAQQANGAAAGDDGNSATCTYTVSTMDAYPALSSGAPSHAQLRLDVTSNTPACDSGPGCGAAVQVSPHARSVFLQLSNTGGENAGKAQLERTATPIVPRSTVQPPHMPLVVGHTAHRTHIILGGY